MKKMMNDRQKDVDQSRAERDIEYAEREKFIKNARFLTTNRELLCLIARLKILHYLEKEIKEKLNLK